jgi:uncharacterized protein (DUF1501 family)
MSTSRRRFLQQLSAAGIVSLGARPPEFLASAAEASTDRGRVLVVIQLAGGNDGLNTVIPFADTEYAKARPGIAIPRDSVLKLDDDVGLHPAMTGMHDLFESGQLAVIQGVGYENPNRSHFRSMDIWHSARPEIEETRDGWLGRAIEDESQFRSGSLPALALGMDRLPLALVSGRMSVPAVRDLSDYRLNLGSGPQRERHVQTLTAAAQLPAAAGSELEFLRSTARTAMTSAERLSEVTKSYSAAAEYPSNGLAARLKVIAQAVAAELGTRVFYLSLGGFDTHSQQEGAHQALLTELSSAVTAFFADLGGHGLADRVMLATFSEFGRRVKENGSLGTDHGAASQMFAVGPKVGGGVHGDHPSLTDLHQGDLKFHTEFRSVYATLLEDWLGVASERVLGSQFPKLKLVG